VGVEHVQQRFQPRAVGGRGLERGVDRLGQGARRARPVPPDRVRAALEAGVVGVLVLAVSPE
jgi:hypothetical protein